MSVSIFSSSEIGKKGLVYQRTSAWASPALWRFTRRHFTKRDKLHTLLLDLPSESVGENLAHFTDNGLPERAFLKKFESFGLGQTNWAEILGCILVISSQTIGTILAL